MKAVWYGATAVGHVREKNEDAWGGVRLGPKPERILLGVADGMGGHPGGDLASQIAWDSCEEAFRTLPPGVPSPDLLEEVFQQARKGLSAYASRHPNVLRMGTTLTLLLLDESGAWVAHIGDSRLFWQRGPEIRLVTTDHSVAWESVQSGTMDPDQAEKDPSGALLTRFLGAGTPFEADILDTPLDLRAGDRLLLCTDGLGKVLPMERVAQVLASSGGEESVQTLIREVLEGGAPDNVTMVRLDVEAPPNRGKDGVAFESLPYCWKAPS